VHHERHIHHHQHVHAHAGAGAQNRGGQAHASMAGGSSRIERVPTLRCDNAGGEVVALPCRKGESAVQAPRQRNRLTEP
jgi:hypothetical protein